MKQIPSPRILATHLNYDCLPKSIFKKKLRWAFLFFQELASSLWQYQHARVILGPHPFLASTQVALGESNLETVGISWCLGWLSTPCSSLRGAVVDINKNRSRGCCSAEKWLECHTFLFYATLFCAQPWWEWMWQQYLWDIDCLLAKSHTVKTLIFLVLGHWTIADT